MRHRLLLRRGVFVAIVLVALFSLDAMNIGQRFLLASGPVFSWVQRPVLWVDELALWLQERAALQEKVIAMEIRLGKQTALFQQTQSLHEENIRLRRLLNVQDIEGYEWHGASVLGRSPDQKSQRIIIQSLQAVVDNVVISSEGLVGLIDARQGEYAVVRTVLDASIAVPVTMQGSDLAALARGDGKQLLLDFIPAVFTLSVGDILFTSGAGGLYPPGIPVARVVRTKAIQGSPFAHVEAVPVAHWQRDHWLAVAATKNSD
ncbi:MAG: rod shape-determining protein MreC [Mariprofundaceae bacterium]|nr:rod shape-determining protein MreC [Mariprofundaceae bacterium]